MRLATLEESPTSLTAIRHDDRYIALEQINTVYGQTWPVSTKPLLDSGRLSELTAWHSDHSNKLDELEGVEVAEASIGPIYRDPAKIWGIGLNYKEHAGDLDEKVPEGLPGSFIKPATTIIGPGDTIQIPKMSERTTAEAELGVVFGKRCKNVPEEDWLSAVAGFTTIIDMTAEDILRRNPRYLTICKSFDSFFVFGPELVTPDEIDDVLSRLKDSHARDKAEQARNRSGKRKPQGTAAIEQPKLDSADRLSTTSENAAIEELLTPKKMKKFGFAIRLPGIPHAGGNG